MEALFKLWCNKEGLLFLWEDGSLLTKTLFIQKVREALKSAVCHNSCNPGLMDKNVRQMGVGIHQNTKRRASVSLFSFGLRMMR